MGILRFILVSTVLIIKILATFGQYVPSSRYSASSEIIGDRLYVMGGGVSSTGTFATSFTSREVIYLDLSKDFNSNSPPWVDYSNISPLPVLNSWADSCKDKDNKTIYVFGGIIEDVNTNNYIIDKNKQIYAFDSIKNTWTTPVVTGIYAPTRRREMKVVMDDLGKMYVFGGLSDSVTGSNITTWYNDMTIFDSNQLTWTRIGTAISSTLRADFTATYLPKNKLIVYIGGRLGDASDFNINEVAN